MAEKEGAQALAQALGEIGFEPAEVEHYLGLALEGDSTAAQRMLLLGEKRRSMLDQIHDWEKRLDKLDYLRYEIRREQDKQNRK